MRENEEVNRIKTFLQGKAIETGLELTSNYTEIAKAKYLCFSKHNESPLKCPCDQYNYERFCISPLCMEEINKKGVCHCGCFRKK